MPLLPNFTASQQTREPSIVRVTDTSTGSDSNITQRRLYFRNSTGAFMVPEGTITDYVLWDYSNAFIDVDFLVKDMGLDLTLEWRDVTNQVLYSLTLSWGFTAFNEDFDYGLTTMMASNPLLFNDNSFFENKSAMRTYIDSGNQSILRNADIFAAQLCYDAGTKLRVNSQYYFNENV